MEKKKNILFYALSLGGGGAQRQIVNIIEEINKEKYDITIFVRYDDTRFVTESLRETKIIALRKNKSENFFRLDVFSELIFLFQIVRKYRISVIYARGYPFYWRASIIKKLFKKVKLISVEANFFSQNLSTKSSFMKLILRELCRFALLNSDLVYCLTKASRADLVSVLNIPTEHAEIFPVVFSLDKFQNIEVRSAVFNKGMFNITCMGRFVRQKNHLFLIDAFQRLDGDNFRLHIFGEGELEREYSKRIKELNLASEILVHSFTSSPYSIIKQSDLVVFPSLFEGFGNILLESILCGTPIIATNFYGIDEWLRGLLAQADLIVDLDDVGGLASRIDYVANNYDLVKQKILMIKNTLGQEYSIEKHIELLEMQIDLLM